MTNYRQWHAPMEWCHRCERYSAVNGNLSCSSGHPIRHAAPPVRAVNGWLMVGALVRYRDPVSYAQAANFLREWNEYESWRTIARRLLGYPVSKRIYHVKRAEVDRTAALLNAHASRRTESDTVMGLLGVTTRQAQTRHRGHVEYGYGEQGLRRKSRVEAALRARGCDSLSEFVRCELLEET